MAAVLWSDFGAKQLAIIPCSLCQRPWIWEFHLKFLTFSFGFTSELNRLKFGSWNQGDRCGPPALLNIIFFCDCAGQASRTACMVLPDGSQRPPPSPPPPYDAHMSRLPMSASAPPLYYGATEAPYSALPPYNSSHGGGASKDSSAKAPFSGSREPLVPPQAGQTVIVVDNATLRPGTCVVCRVTTKLVL